MHFFKKEIAADIFQKSGKFESRSSKPAQSAQAMPLPQALLGAPKQSQALPGGPKHFQAFPGADPQA